MITLRQTLISAATQYDSKQVGKRGHNIWALPQYFQAIDAVMERIEAGSDPRAAIVHHFNGRLAAALLRAANLPAYTVDDARAY